MTHELWARAILAIGAIVVVPLGLSLVRQRPSTGHLGAVVLLLAAALLAVSQFVPAGKLAASFAAPWLVVTAMVALAGLKRAWIARRGPLSDLTIAAGMIYLAIGGYWAIFDRAGLRPLDFDPAIVLLTAIHFHYAGFALPILTGLAIRTHSPDALSRLTALGVILSVPLTAVGITASQLGYAPLLELIAAWCMSLAGLGVAWLYVRLAMRPATSRWARELWIGGAIFLACGMVLSLAYGTRAYLPLPWLDIPRMRAVHGTANALGFTLPCLAGWLYRRAGCQADSAASASSSTAAGAGRPSR